MERSPATLEARLNALAALGERLDRAAPDDAPADAVAAVVAELGLSAGWIFLSDTVRGDAREGGLSLGAAHGIPPALARDDAAELRCGSCECQRLFRGGRLDRGVNMVTCSRLAGAEGDTGGLSLHASVPLQGREGPQGILNLAASGDHRFSKDELAFLGVVGRQLGAALERTRLAEAHTQAARFGAALEERQRLAREMHDALSQLLFAAGLQLQLARAGREGGLDEAEALLDDARAELRTLVEAGRSPDLSAGLTQALERLAARMAGVVEVHLDAAAEPAAEAIEDALYRTAQEALHNAVRHGHARSVRIALRDIPEGWIELSVADDGDGCEPERVRAGSGMRGLRERAAALGGELTVERASEGGIRVAVHVPKEERGT